MDRPPSTPCSATSCSLPATQGQRHPAKQPPSQNRQRPQTPTEPRDLNQPIRGRLVARHTVIEDKKGAAGGAAAQGEGGGGAGGEVGGGQQGGDGGFAQG